MYKSMLVPFFNILSMTKQWELPCNLWRHVPHNFFSAGNKHPCFQCIYSVFILRKQPRDVCSSYHKAVKLDYLLVLPFSWWTCWRSSQTGKSCCSSCRPPSSRRFRTTGSMWHEKESSIKNQTHHFSRAFACKRKSEKLLKCTKTHNRPFNKMHIGFNFTACCWKTTATTISWHPL